MAAARRLQEPLVLNPLLFGTIGAVIALAMLVAELFGFRGFTLQLTAGCGLPLWTLFGTYAALQFIVWRYATRPVDLTPRELERWGPKLEEVTPTILALYGQQKTVRDIAAELARSHGIPKHITLRYIIALGRHLRERQDAQSSVDAQHAPDSPTRGQPEPDSQPDRS